MRIQTAAAALAAAFCLCGPAQAAVVGGAITGGTVLGTGDFEELNPAAGFTVGNDVQQSPNLFAFNEFQNVTLTAPITPDVGAVIPTGTVVASHYVFFDPAGTSTVEGYVDFDAIILGVATARGTLLATDSLITSGVNYLNPSLRGLEPQQDSVSIGDSATLNGARLLVDFQASTPGDYVRVFTARSPKFGDDTDPGVVPLPAAGWLLLGAIGGMAAYGRRRGKTA